MDLDQKWIQARPVFEVVQPTSVTDRLLPCGQVRTADVR